VLTKEEDMSNTTTTRKDQAHEYLEKAKETAGTVADKVKDAAGTAVDKAKDMAAHAGQAVGSAATAVGHKADSAAGSVGSGMRSLGETVRDKGPEQGVFGKASEGVACALEKGGRYLEERQLSGMAEDFTELVRRNPIPALLIGIGLGFLLARTLRS